MNGHKSESLIAGIAHVNLTIPRGTLDQAFEFYGETLGLISVPVPQLQKGTLAWFNIADSGQMIHVAFNDTPNSPKSTRHPCFNIPSPDALLQLRRKIYEHYQRGGEAAPMEADKPGEEASGAKGVEYPQRFFARDFAGNRLEFSL